MAERRHKLSGAGEGGARRDTYRSAHMSGQHFEQRFLARLHDIKAGRIDFRRICVQIEQQLRRALLALRDGADERGLLHHVDGVELGAEHDARFEALGVAPVRCGVQRRTARLVAQIRVGTVEQ